jgi:hypothetical protein
MSRKARRRNHAHERPVLNSFTRLERIERDWAHHHGDALRYEAERAMQRFKQSLPPRALRSIGEYRSMKAETRAQMKRTGRPKAGKARQIPITPENEQEALQSLASCSKTHPPDGIKTVAADAMTRGTTERDYTASAVRKQDDAVARTVFPADEKPASQRVGAVIGAADAGAPKQAV